MAALDSKIEFIESLNYLDLFGYATNYGVTPYLYVSHRFSSWGHKPRVPIWTSDPEYDYDGSNSNYALIWSTIPGKSLYMEGYNISNMHLYAPNGQLKTHYSLFKGSLNGPLILEKVIPYEERFLHDAYKRTIELIRKQLR